MELEEIIIRRKASELSGWQQKRLCIARALTADPKIIVFDEAVSGLDMAGRKNILDLLKCIHNARGKTFLLITHDIDAAIYTSSRIAVMRDGKIFEDMRCNGDFRVFENDYSNLKEDNLHYYIHYDIKNRRCFEATPKNYLYSLRYVCFSKSQYSMYGFVSS